MSGGNSGLGKEIALRFARSGYRVFAGARDPARAEDLVDQSAREGLAIEILALDVDDEDSVDRATRRVLDTTERLDVLVNNAGIGVFGVAEEVRFDEVRRVMETNFFGALRLTQAFLPHLRATRGGTLAFISSWMGRVPVAGMLSYACSKAALECFAETVAQEVLRFDVSVYIVEPGYAQTPMHAKAPRYELPAETPYEDIYRNWRSHWKVGYRNPTPPEEVAEVLVRAVESGEARLRLPVGDDARRWVEARRAASDEAWRELGRPRSLEDFLRWAEGMIGPGMFRA